ncbi:MAG TPA: VTT domain-containing protein [Planctomycetota bacterium]|nr:VTT domain-containing protein [Planctomycetota bacterium]
MPLPCLTRTPPAGLLQDGVGRLAAWLGGLSLAGKAAGLAAATFLSEDLTTICAGLLVAKGELDWVTALVGCTLGIWIGDGLLWLIGRVVGRPALRLPVLRRMVSPAQLARAERWFARRGLRVVLVSRFLPGSRLPAFFAAGVLGARAGWFLGWALLAALLWTPLLIGGSVLLAPRVEAALARLSQLPGAAKLLPPVVSLLLLVIVLRLLESLSTWRGRRLLAARWKRRITWEFWPAWAFYVPTALWYLALAARHRSLTLPTVANPGMDGGGFIGESKGQILHDLVAGRTEAQPFVARTLRLPPAPRRGPDPGSEAGEARWPALRDWMAAHGVGFPIVLKPDVGQRGSGVRLVRTETEARDYLAGMPLALIAQEYAPGPHELGVYWIRAPGDAAGRIVSVTEKFFTEVVGDGTHTLEELIVLHPRAVLQAQTFFRRHAELLDWVPEPGARFPLVTSGNHCQGTLFKDGARLASEPLRARLDALADGYPGLHVGRFDLRAADLPALLAGEAFRIVEVNGATAEATHIYDPAFGRLRGPVVAYRTLFTQWSVVFAIGARNRAAGHRPLGVRNLLGRVLAFRREQRHHPPAT